MKKSVILRLMTFLIGLALLGSCSSNKSTPKGARRSSVPPQCEFTTYKKTTPKKSATPPPAHSTPIGGNYRIRY